MDFRSASIDFNSNIPYYLQLIELLKGKIQAGEWQTGDQIPSEPDLCEEYGISRTVVRQALHAIELEGLIIRRKGKGTFVAEPKYNEGWFQKLTGFYQDMVVERGLKVLTQVLCMEVEPASTNIADLLQLKPEAQVFCIERLRFVDQVPIVLVSTYIPFDLCPDLGKFDLGARSLYEVLEKEFGLVISHGRRTIEAVAANEREAQYLQIEDGDPMILINSVTYMEDGTPMEYYHAIHRGDRSRFEVDLVRYRDTDIISGRPVPPRGLYARAR
jgi:GntR family transcriptional regulator